jgi:hypothetical protein
MAIDYSFVADTSMSVAECRSLLMRELRLEISHQHPKPWLFNAGATVIPYPFEDRGFHRKVLLEVFGFVPTLEIGIRPVLSAAQFELGAQTMMRVVDLMLRSTEGNAGFALENERVLLLRKDGVLYAREDFTNHLNSEDLDLISMPYQFAPLRP